MNLYINGNIFVYLFKIPKLKYFILQSVISDDLQLNYLKWILNRVNYIEKLKLRLDVKNTMNRNFIVDADVLREHFMPDLAINLINFDFYIASKCKLLLSNDIQRIIDSFKTHRFLVDDHRVNIQCFFDPIMSYQHLSSTTIIEPKFHDGIM
jgi:hypothetical protein